MNTAKRDQAATTDTVALSPLTRPATEQTSLTAASATAAKSSGNAQPGGADQSGMAVARVEYLYDSRGEVLVKFLDTADRLVYQTPSELALQLRDGTAHADQLLDTVA